MSSKPKPREPDTPLLEWICGAVGAILFLGVVSVTVVNSLSQGEPPSFTTRVSDIRADASGLHHVTFSIFNAGDETAAAIQVAASIERAGQMIESHTVEVDFLPPHSRREAVVIFKTAPQSGDVVLDALAYRHP